jgi:hypothetical protein
MLIEFDSEVGKLTMFGDVAIQLLKLLGHSATVPSAILASDIPVALERLERGVSSALPVPPVAADSDDDEREPRVSLQQRAYPLIDLLQRAAAKNCDVMWKKI